ncbi:hypothetical protein BDZ45DRAFT_197520 [Acephala macrosclerotiorum]|nr:hypothetical protein BDZ45DRAFT_197520 [Acephala macrosclerotiorum]
MCYDAKVSDEQQARGPAKAKSTGESKKSLSRPDGEGSDFSDRSSKRRTHPTKPYKCLEPDCVKRFAQQQNLDRHIERDHRAVPTKYYHCTVDGCKYASTGEWRKSFLRVDQVKEHIKDYGHYGPHSATDRPRRPEKQISQGQLITIYFEEWTSSGEGTHERTIQSYEYDSSKTTLWHEDDTGDLYCCQKSDRKLAGFPCQEINCYYHEHPPDRLEKVFFNTMKGLQEHLRRAHEPPGPPIIPGLQQLDRQESLPNLTEPQASNDVQSFGGTLFDPNNPALFDFDLGGLNVRNHFSALKFGHLGHMASGSEESATSNPSSGSTMNTSSVDFQVPSRTSGTIIGDVQTLDTFNFGDYVDYTNPYDSKHNWFERYDQASMFGAANAASTTAAQFESDTFAILCPPWPGDLSIDFDTTTDNSLKSSTFAWRESATTQSDATYSTAPTPSTVANSAPPHRYKCYAEGCKLSFRREKDRKHSNLGFTKN